MIVASNYGHTDVVKELAYRGADMDLKTVNLILIVTIILLKVCHNSQSAGDTALHIATIRNNSSVVEALVELKADLNATNKVMQWLMGGGGRGERGHRGPSPVIQ